MHADSTQGFTEANILQVLFIQRKNISKFFGINGSKSHCNKVLVIFMFTIRVKDVNNCFTLSCNCLPWVTRRIEWKGKPSILRLSREFLVSLLKCWFLCDGSDLCC